MEHETTKISFHRAFTQTLLMMETNSEKDVRLMNVLSGINPNSCHKSFVTPVPVDVCLLSLESTVWSFYYSFHEPMQV